MGYDTATALLIRLPSVAHVERLKREFGRDQAKATRDGQAAESFNTWLARRLYGELPQPRGERALAR